MNAVTVANPCLARAFIQPQVYAGRFSPMEGLYRGTVFPELFSPYVPSRYIAEGGACHVR